MRKRVFVGMMSICLLLSLAACGEKESASEAGEAGDAQIEAASDAGEAVEATEEVVLKQLPKEPTEEGAKYFKLASDAYQHNDYDNTLKYCDQAIEAGDGRAAMIAANVRSAQGKAAEAMEYLMTGYEMDGLNAEYIAGIGLYYLNGYGTEKNIEEAKKYYEEALLYGYTDAEAVLADIENGVYDD